MDPSQNYQCMAMHMRVQPPFLSKVMNGASHFTRDQLYLACEYFGLDDESVAFLELLQDYQASGLKKRQDSLLNKIRAIQIEQRDTQTHLSESVGKLSDEQRRVYYLDPYCQLVHVCLSIDRFSKKPLDILPVLLIPKQKFLKVLNTLEQLGIINLVDGQVEVHINDLHLSRDATEYAAWNTQLRLLALNRVQMLSKEDSYGFSVVFSADEATKKKIHDHFLEFMKKIEKLVQKAPAEQVYQMSFDLFGWT